MSVRNFDKGRKRPSLGPEAKPEERAKAEPEIAHSYLSIPLGERLRKRAPMTNIKDQRGKEKS